ncbi:MAG TPA: serpin family protein, partial [Fimbriimonadaceae bacterium]|nr:serpin family protein [Fimbriimonadaceae bacterium]
MKARLPRSWIVLIGIFLVGCGHHGESYSDNGSAPTPDQLAAEKPLADSLDAFAFRLKDQIVATDRGKNICFSPISMQFALSTLLNGTAGKSVDSLRSVLGFGKVPLDQVNAANKALADNLSGPDVTIANAIWLNSAIQPLPDFTKRLEDFYAADFFADP